MHDTPAPYHPPPPSDVTTNPVDPWRQVPVQFTGQGAMYFRIWIVNLLLTLVTLGLYYPWAKVRRLQFFYGNTLIDGQPLSFHGDPKQMFKGYLIAVALFGIYSGVSKYFPEFHWVLLAALGLFYPVLVRASRRFMMANIGWHGLRFRFTGTSKDALLSYLPFALGCAVIAALQWGGYVRMDMPTQPTAEESGYFISLMLGYSLFISVLGLWAVARFLAYLQGNLGWGPLRTRFEGRMRSLVGLVIKCLLLYLAAVVVVIFVVVLSTLLGNPYAEKSNVSLPQLATFLTVLLGLALALSLVAITTFVPAYFQSRKQNLIWNPTCADHLKIESALRCLPLWRLKLKNALLIVVTLGMYIPYAAVVVNKMRLESVTLASDLDFDAIEAYSNKMAGNVTGDAVADIFDLDLGF